jgi:hypothetical protein
LVGVQFPMCPPFSLLLWLQEMKMNKNEVLEKAKAFSKEVIELAKKYDIQDISSCGCCGGTSLYFTNGECIEGFSLQKDKITFEHSVVENGCQIRLDKYSVD